ncbi:hypothetical protein B0H13DRAFT_2345867 [Mycena leptocephala]|nr:hypothetical protein B0H13DRAFT_2345867 [Mycena leptocephala]
MSLTNDATANNVRRQLATLPAQVRRLKICGDHSGATECYSAWIRAVGFPPGLHSQLTQSYLTRKRYEAAEAAATQALVCQPENGDARWRRALARKHLNDIPGALVDVATALATNPHNPLIRTELARLLIIHREAEERRFSAEDLVWLSWPHAFERSSSNVPRSNLQMDHEMALTILVGKKSLAKMSVGIS